MPTFPTSDDDLPELDEDDAPYLTAEDFARLRREGKLRIEPNNNNWVKVIRARVGMNQAEFAEAFNLNLRTIQDWEQGRYEPDTIARNYLKTIAAMPDDVHKVVKPD